MKDYCAKFEVYLPQNILESKIIKLTMGRITRGRIETTPEILCIISIERGDNKKLKAKPIGRPQTGGR
jgi:hypothetical protein